jgi:hypothetical protein
MIEGHWRELEKQDSTRGTVLSWKLYSKYGCVAQLYLGYGYRTVGWSVELGECSFVKKGI